jgi:hypothetical protein
MGADYLDCSFSGPEIIGRSLVLGAHPLRLLPVDHHPITCLTSRARGLAAALLFWMFICTTVSLGQTQSRSILCVDGNGALDTEFRSAIRVQVGPARDGLLATRSCSAKLAWEKRELVVATGASQVDVDAFGVDFGDGTPTAAFQIKRFGADCCMDYQIYSLDKSPRMLRKITGGEFFSASDVDLDGRIEIWTNDAAVVSGFEGLSLGEFDSAPTLVLRFARGQLEDVSAEFAQYFDDEISKRRGEIPAQDLEDFKSSDGKLSPSPSISPERMHRLRRVKIKALEIVWAYFYSGREPEAWRSLSEMWAPADLERIRAAIVNARAHGIHGQAEVTSAAAASDRKNVKKKHAQIFDAVTRSGPGRGELEVVPPRAILLRRPPAPEIQTQGPESEVFLDLVIDAAGKVRSAGSATKMKPVDPELTNAALTWKFIPALREDRPVASRLRLGVSSRQ